MDNRVERLAPVPRRGLGRPRGADGLDQRRTLPRAGALAAGRSCRRGAPRRRPPGGSGDGRIDRDHFEFGVWAKISPDWKGACGMMLLFVQFVRFVRRFPEGPTGKRVPAMGDKPNCCPSGRPGHTEELSTGATWILSRGVGQSLLALTADTFSSRRANRWLSSGSQTF